MPFSPSCEKSRHKAKISRQKVKRSLDHPKSVGKAVDSASSREEVNNVTVFVSDVAPPQTPQNWPVTISYLQRPIISPYLTESQRRWLRQKPLSTYIYSDLTPDVTGGGEAAVPVIKLPVVDVAERTEIRAIQDTAHPACGQHGQFAVRDLSPGAFVLPYLGYVHSSTTSEHDEFERQKVERENSNALERPNDGDAGSNTAQQIGSWDRSDYDLNLHRDDEIELAIDAALMGNEARFCNDYRGVPAFVDSTTDTQKDSWNRRAKRAAKTQASDTGLSSAIAYSQTWQGHDSMTAIPNAEFRDVWFEWTTDGSEEARINGDVAARNCDGFYEVDVAMKHLYVDDTSGAYYEKDLTEIKSNPELCTSRSDRRRRKNKMGMRGVAIFVLPAGKSGKRKNGIRAGQEVLVSYGKGFWAHHTSEVDQRKC